MKTFYDRDLGWFNSSKDDLSDLGGGYGHSAERQLRDNLASLQREYQAKAKPIIDALVAIEMRKPPKPMVLTIEQASRLDLAGVAWVKETMRENGT
jgi:hypothetical protein